MTEETFEPLSATELAEIDAQYRPFPPIADWPTDVPELDLWQQSRQEFQLAADQASESDIENAHAIVRRVAAFDTGAIEGLYSTNRGLTFTVAEQSALWEQRVDAQGPDARALFEAQLRESYVVHTPVGPQTQPLPKGKYKRYPDHVRTKAGAVHAYAPVESTQAEMERLIDELERPEFQEAHPIIQASYAHYALVVVHPFADGNGRLARAAASIYTYREASIPLMVLDEHRDRYLFALSRADSGDPRPFIGFISEVTRETLDLVKDNLATAKAPQPDDVLQRFGDLLRSDHQGELDQVGSEFAERFHLSASEQIAALGRPDGVEIVTATLDSNIQAPSGYREILVSGPKGIRLTFRAFPPLNQRCIGGLTYMCRPRLTRRPAY